MENIWMSLVINGAGWVMALWMSKRVFDRFVINLDGLKVKVEKIEKCVAKLEVEVVKKKRI